jgi:Asp-tRNA(Asn)/Glu-tRNA(Gln) amidotransferase A subunit family amidase
MDLPSLPINATNLASAFAEISAVWDEMVRNGLDAQLSRQDADHIGNLCRTTQIMPAIAYIQANRIRTLLMKAMADIMVDLDIYVAPQSRIDEPSDIHLNLWLTNLTGHPAVVVPNGFARSGKPTGISFIGNLYGEGKLLALAKAYQDETEFHRKHPSTFGG